MAMYILKGLCVIGILLNVILMAKKTKELRANPEKDPELGLNGEELWKRGLQPRNLIATCIIGFFANFFDTLGIGSFAPSSAGFKLTKSVDDILVPGTLNVGDTVPVCVEAFLFFGFVEMDILTLVLMIVVSILGLFILASVVLMKNLGVGPFGTQGEALGLRGIKLVVAVVGNFIFGALMSIGVGLYAPCMAMVLALGMNASCAFPAMMGSCAFLMAFGNGPKFVSAGRFDPVACWTQAIFGAIGVYVAYKFVGSMDINVLTKVIVVVVYITAFLYLHDAIKKGDAA